MPSPAATALADARRETALGMLQDFDIAQVNVPRTTPRSISPKALRAAKQAGVGRKAPNPLAATVRHRFPATRALIPDVHSLLVEVYGGEHRVPPAGSLVSLADYASLLKWAPESFRLTEPTYDQQPGELMDDYTLFQLYLRQAEFIPFEEGERKVRTLTRFYRIFDDGLIPDIEDALEKPPLPLVEGLRKAWSWDYRAQMRDARLVASEAENAAVKRLRRGEAIREEFDSFLLSTLRASRQCVESGNPELVRKYAGAFGAIFGAKAPSGFIMDALQHLDGAGPSQTLTVTAPKGSEGVAQFAWRPAGPPPAPPAQA